MGFELLIASGCIALLAAHPYTTYPASLFVLERLAPRPVRSGKGLPHDARVALCVCAYNEEQIIREKAENMLAMQDAFPGLELLIYVDGAADRTAEILAAYADRIHVVASQERRGKTHGMNTLVAATGAEFVAFSDANVMFESDALSCLIRPFADPDVGCVCGHLLYNSKETTATASTGSLYWRLEETIKELESRTGSTMGADGSIFAIRRRLHRPPPADIIDDMFVSLSILCDRYRVIRQSDARAYEELVSQPGEDFQRRIRIACQAFNVHRLLRGRLRRLSLLDRYKYTSHKLLRWLSGYLFAAAGVGFVAGLGALEAWFALAVIGIVTLAVGTFSLLCPASLPGKLMGMVMSILATAIGVRRSLRGERFQTWNPPQSARSSTLEAVGTTSDLKSG